MVSFLRRHKCRHKSERFLLDLSSVGRKVSVLLFYIVRDVPGSLMIPP